MSVSTEMWGLRWKGKGERQKNGTSLSSLVWKTVWKPAGLKECTEGRAMGMWEKKMVGNKVERERERKGRGWREKGERKRGSDRKWLSNAVLCVARKPAVKAQSFFSMWLTMKLAGQPALQESMLISVVHVLKTKPIECLLFIMSAVKSMSWYKTYSGAVVMDDVGRLLWHMTRPM